MRILPARSACSLPRPRRLGADHAACRPSPRRRPTSPRRRPTRQNRVRPRDQGRCTPGKRAPTIPRKTTSSPSTTPGGRPTARCSTARSPRGKPASFPLGRVIAGFSEGAAADGAGREAPAVDSRGARLQGRARAEGHAGVRRRADRHPDARAGRRQGAAGRREEDRERPRLQSAAAGRRRTPPAAEQRGHGALHRLDDRRQDVRQLGRARPAVDVRRSTASSRAGPKGCS